MSNIVRLVCLILESAMNKKSYRHVRVSGKDWNLIKGSNDIRVVIYRYCDRMDGVTEEEIENWLAVDFNPSMIPAMMKYWLPEMESYGELYFENGLWYAGDEHGDIGRRRTESLRRTIRMLILESNTTVGHKMIFLAGLPGAGKSTLLRQLGIEDQFTNCNIDNFFEPRLMDTMGTKNLHPASDTFFRLRAIRDERPLTQKELAEYEEAKAFRGKERTLFIDSINKFKKQIDEVCQVGSNFIIDGTAANYDQITNDAIKYKQMGYDCAMIFVDIDVDVSIQRNLQRGVDGGRSIYSGIIQGQGERLPEHVEPYRKFFGGDRFFLVDNRGTFPEYKKNIEAIRPGVDAFMRA